MKIISGSAHPALARKIAKAGRFKLVPVEISEFANGERRVWIRGTIEGEHVAIVQTLSFPTDRNLIELLFLIDAARRLHPARITAVVPWLGYSRQDKVFRPGEPISAKVVAKIIGTAGADDVVTMDLHQESIVGFFDVPVKHLSARPLFAKLVKQNRRTLVVSPDLGGAKRAREFAKLLHLPLAVVDKERARQTGKITVHGVSRPVRGYHCLVLDDMVVTGGTIKTVCQALKAGQAAGITFCATHGQFSAKTWENLDNGILDKIVTTDTLPVLAAPTKTKLEILTTASLFAKALKELHGK